jgi:hypothetical protein
MPALSFFQMPALDFKFFPDIYIALDQGSSPGQQQQVVDSWVTHYRQSQLFQTYVATTLSLQAQTTQSNPSLSLPRLSPSGLRQSWVLIQRIKSNAIS